MFPLWTLFLLLLCYLLGALPFGLWLGRRAGVDLSQQGSGNTGAANAARILGARFGLSVLLLDMFKGALATLLAYLALAPLGPAQLCFGLAAVLGHNYSVFRGFKGGKGIATTFGVVLVLSPKVFLLAGLLWIGLVGLTRFSSVGSLVATSAVPLLMVYYLAPWSQVIFGLAAAGLAFWRHRDNLQRLLDGRELKID